MQKLVTITLLCALTMAFGFQAPNKQIKKDLQSMEWVLGNWKRVDTNASQTTYEKWKKVSDLAFNGIGLTLKGKDTTFIEKLKILIKDDKMFYVAEVSHNKNPIYFQITEHDESGFIASNPNHDFPKKISYQLDVNRLQAEISGNGKSIGFNFVRIE